MSDKKIVITGYREFGDMHDVQKGRKNIIAVGDESMDAHDGYHSFSELYDHRITLYIALCKRINAEDESQKSLKAFKEGFAFDRNGWIRKVWRSKYHSDGELCFGTGTQFVLGIGKEQGKQVTYHIPVERWDEAGFAETLEKAPEWDGHTSADVIERLKNI